MITRGKFIASGAAIAVAGPDVTFGGGNRRPHLRLGVLSDPHIKGEGTEGALEKALRFFDRNKADAVACCGDLATSGIVPELERVGATWKRGFPVRAVPTVRRLSSFSSTVIMIWAAMRGVSRGGS